MTFLFWKRRRAANNYECAECGWLIQQGNYHFVFGVPARHRICLMCASAWDASDRLMDAALLMAPYDRRPL